MGAFKNSAVVYVLSLFQSIDIYNNCKPFMNFIVIKIKPILLIAHVAQRACMIINNFSSLRSSYQK